MVAVGDRDARVGGPGDGGGHSGDHLERAAGLGQGHGLLASSPEQKGISPLEPHDHLPGFRFLHKKGVDLRLRKRMAARLLAREEDLGPFLRISEKNRIAQMVVHHHVRDPEAVAAFECQQQRIPGAGPDQIANSLGHPPRMPRNPVLIKAWS